MQVLVLYSSSPQSNNVSNKDFVTFQIPIGVLRLIYSSNHIINCDVMQNSLA